MGALAATGWLGGVAAADFSKQQARQAADQAASTAEAARAAAGYDAAVGRKQATAGDRRVVLRQRPVRTRVTYRYVTSGSSVSVVGPGGTVSTPQQAPGAANSPTTAHQAPSHTQPATQPAPTSGS